ncbi:MAG TPA: nucleotide sugar dehydrogenase [Candidatus Acidoferrales bacterium]|nr:nucleotide sugar dehydrogenase [Candidatus Acidoferrales bacterium]
METLKARLHERSATAAVIGLGYVGLPLALEIARAGFRVIGLDIDQSKIAALKQGRSYILDVKDGEIGEALRQHRFLPSGDFGLLGAADTISICVPTPLSKSRDPDISFILAAAEVVKKTLRPGQLVILESTTYPGTTEELILPELEATGLVVGKDFYLAFSPERIDPGNRFFSTRNTPKVLGGVTPKCTEMAAAFYSQFVDRVVPVSSTKCAEMVKLLENTFRSVNIAMVNEMALMCDLLGVDVYEVIDAAATKPFGFIPFYPGPGLGGHCIPIDPHYLAWKLKALNFHARFISLAAEINGMMPAVVCDLVTEGLNRFSKSVRGSRVMILGVSYKKGVNDCRESPAIDLIKLLCEKGARISYNDPFVPALNVGPMRFASVELTPAAIQDQDCLVIVTDHDAYDFADILRWSRLVVDTRNATKGLHQFADRILKLGAGNDRSGTGDGAAPEIAAAADKGLMS